MARAAVGFVQESTKAKKKTRQGQAVVQNLVHELVQNDLRKNIEDKGSEIRCLRQGICRGFR